MKLDCKECGASILAEDIDLPSKMAKCRSCHAVFSFADRFGAPPAAERPRMRAPRPEGLVVHDGSSGPMESGYRDFSRGRGTVTIVRRWFAPHFIFLLFFCFAWDSFLFFWYTNAFSASGQVEWIMVLFPVAHLAAGVGLTYYTLAGFLNRTTIALDERNLSIRHAPLPWKGNRTIARDEIQQLFCEEEISNNRNTAQRMYYLSVVMRDGQKLRLASMSVEQGKYIEDVLEEKLGIADMNVPGEVR